MLNSWFMDTTHDRKQLQFLVGEPNQSRALSCIAQSLPSECLVVADHFVHRFDVSSMNT